MINELVRKNRSYRRFYENLPINRDILIELIELARLSPSARNQQALKFILVSDEELNAKVFPEITWAGYLKEWHGPEKGERPSGYIIILGDKECGKNYDIDLGIAAQSILFGAVEKGFGGCMILAFNKKNIKKIFNIPDRYETSLIIALGKPLEIVVIDEMNEEGDIKYWRDEKQVHHVPKRSLDDLIVEF
ncbi:nitroreductase family protein [Bacteroidota bacterium]